MVEFFYRTEDIKPDEVLNYFVETKEDRSILKDLKAHNPVILIGGRGVGKSFLLRVAENELLLKYEALPVFQVGSLII
jgi:chromosomal replication initiation ATPase DnaA